MKIILVLSFSLLFSASLMAKWSAGVATIVPSNPYLGTDTEVRVLPIVTYEGERLSWRGPSLSYKLSGFERGEPSFALSLNLAPNQLDTDDSDR
jgi:outer membrane protein